MTGLENEKKQSTEDLQTLENQIFVAQLKTYKSPLHMHPNLDHTGTAKKDSFLENLKNQLDQDVHATKKFGYKESLRMHPNIRLDPLLISQLN
jgi:hypothetical protein